jgi:subtilisin family serine protease
MSIRLSSAIDRALKPSGPNAVPTLTGAEVRGLLGLVQQGPEKGTELELLVRTYQAGLQDPSRTEAVPEIGEDNFYLTPEAGRLLEAFFLERKVDFETRPAFEGGLAEGDSVLPVIEEVTADGRVTQSEWTATLKPAATALPKRATDGSRALMDLWANGAVAFDTGTRRELSNVLRTMGYQTEQTDAAPTAAQVSAAYAANVTEQDVLFEQLIVLTGQTQNETTVAVADAGFQIDHQAFEGKLWTNPGETAGNGVDDDGNGLIDDIHGWDFASGDANVSGDRHGTHVTGIATRGTDRLNTISVRVFSPYVIDRVVAGMEYACKNGARLINLSFKINDAPSVAAVKALMARYPNVLFVKAAGNEGRAIGTGTFVPDRYLQANVLPNMVVVAAADANGAKASYSNFALPYTDVAMRGSAVFSSVINGYAPLSGTSMSSPNVAAVAGKAFTLCPSLTAAEMKRLLVETSDPRDDWRTFVNAGGLVNADRVMRFAALLHLARSGMAADAAAEQIQLTGPEREKLLQLLPSYLSSP